MKEIKKYTKNIEKSNLQINEIDIIELKKLRNRAKEITDIRMKNKCTYKIWDIVCVVLIATLCNCNDWEDIYLFANENKKWLRSFLQLTGGIPTATTYKNIMAIINPQELQNFCI